MSSRARFLFPIYMLILLAGLGVVLWASWGAAAQPYYTKLAATGQLDKLVDFNAIKLLAPVPDLNKDKRYGPLARQSPAYNNATAHKPGFYILSVLPPDSRKMRWYIFAGIAMLAGGAIYLSTRLIANTANTFSKTTQP